jgi:hypothetical protein
MLALPFPPRRSHLRAFRLGVTIASAVGLFLVCRALGWSAAWLIALAIAAGVYLVGWVWSGLSLRLYRLWNRAAGRVGALARVWLVALLHYAVLSLSRSDGTELNIHHPGGSLWQAYHTGASHLSFGPDSRAGWVSQFVREAWRPGRRWWLLLLPLFLLLSLFTVDEDRREVVPENIYTLF